MRIQFEAYEPKEPSPEEIAEEEKWLKPIKHYCPHCKKTTLFVRCFNCNKRYCNEHAIEETEGNWESGYITYTICYHCEV